MTRSPPADGADRPNAPRTTVGDWLREARRRLRQIEDDAEATTEAALLLLHTTGRSRASLYARPDDPLDAESLAALDGLLARRLDGEPLAHLTGTREFWSLEFEVGPDVLVPRADTETLVERALETLPHLPAGAVVDAGTGCGAIAVALAVTVARECARPLIAIERHAAALAVARRNAARHLPSGRLAFVHGDWLAAFAEASVALLVSNPPYLAARDPHLPTLAHEPRTALVSGEDGLDAVRHLIGQARRVVMPGGAVLIEHGFAQGAAVRALFARGDHYDAITTARDLAGHERVTMARRVNRPDSGCRVSRSRSAAR